MINEFFFQTIQEEGKRLGIPLDKKRALLREYLQTKVIASLYNQEESKRLSCIGGTSLRLLRGLDRFSEDIDFDNLGLSFLQTKAVFGTIAKQLQGEGFPIEYAMKKTNSSGIGEIRFPNLLFELNISSHRSEKLAIKIDYTIPRIKPETEFVILSRFGFVQNVRTNTLEVLFAQKIRAVFQRKDPQPRDFYDIVWFLSKNVQPNLPILSQLGFKTAKEAFEKLGIFYQQKIQAQLPRFKQRLQPFLLEESHISYLDMFPHLVNQAAGKK